MITEPTANMNELSPNDGALNLQALLQENAVCAKCPQQISRYLIERVLGQGGVGFVNLV